MHQDDPRYGVVRTKCSDDLFVALIKSAALSIVCSCILLIDLMGNNFVWHTVNHLWLYSKCLSSYGSSSDLHDPKVAGDRIKRKHKDGRN